jgi:hypothetical protein
VGGGYSAATCVLYKPLMLCAVVSAELHIFHLNEFSFSCVIYTGPFYSIHIHGPLLTCNSISNALLTQ